MSRLMRTQIGHMAMRSIVRTLRQPELTIPSIAFPLFLLAVNAGALEQATRLPGFPTTSYLTFALAATLMQGALFATTTVGSNVAEDVATGFLDRLSLTPMRRTVVLTAQLAASTVFATGQATVYLAVGLAGGATIRTGLLGALLLVALTVLTANAFAAVGTFWAVRTGSGEAVQALFPLLFVTFFLSSLFIPRQLMTTDWFRTVATYNPVSYIIEGMRSLIVDGWDPEALGRAGGCAGALLVGGLAAASMALRARRARG